MSDKRGIKHLERVLKETLNIGRSCALSKDRNDEKGTPERHFEGVFKKTVTTIATPLIMFFNEKEYQLILEALQAIFELGICEGYYELIVADRKGVFGPDAIDDQNLNAMDWSKKYVKILNKMVEVLSPEAIKLFIEHKDSFGKVIIERSLI